jgi:hypothetical protein
MALPVVLNIAFCTGAKESDLPSARFRAMPQSSYVPDLIHAADAVLGKLGYGFVSECVTSGTALVYVPRVDWPEEPYLEVTIIYKRLCCPQYGFSVVVILLCVICFQKLLMETYHAGVRMPQQSFLSGDWHEYIQQAAALKGSWLGRGEDDFASASAQIVEILEQQVARRKAESGGPNDSDL